MKVGEKKTKEITLNESFVFLIEIERIPDNSSGMFDYNGKDYEQVRPYEVSITNLGGETFSRKIRVFGYKVRDHYHYLIEKAQHFIDSTSSRPEDELFDEEFTQKK